MGLAGLLSQIRYMKEAVKIYIFSVDSGTEKLQAFGFVQNIRPDKLTYSNV